MVSGEYADEQMLTVDEVADWLQLEKPYVYQLARTGALGSTRFGRYVRIPAGSVRAFIKANTAEPVSLPVRGARRPGARARRLRRAS
jgi:excisionase family DNA binding protein